jgi:WD40 repeat protein
VLARLDPADQARMRHVLVQMVRPGEGTEDTRQVATRAQLHPDDWPLVVRLADANTRLVVTGHDEAAEQDTAELVHETLIRHWQPLRDWINADRAFRLWQNGLRQAMGEWERTGRDDGALLAGARLAEAEERIAADAGRVSEAEVRYVQASVGRRDAEAAERERQRRSRARIRRNVLFGSLLATSAVIVLTALVVVAVVALETNLVASQLAESRALAQNARDVVASGDAELGALLALTALPADFAVPDRPFSAEAEAALIFALTQYSDRRVFAAPSGEITAAAAAGPDHLVLGSSDGRLWLADIDTGAEERVLSERGYDVTSVGAYGTGLIAVGRANGSVTVFADNRKPILIAEHRSPVDLVSFAANGTALLVRSTAAGPSVRPNRVTLHRGSLFELTDALSDERAEIALTHDGSLFGYQAGDRIVVVDPSSGAALPHLDGAGSYSSDPFSLSDGGRLAAFGDWQGAGQVIDLTKGGLPRAFSPTLTFRSSMQSAISRDGQFVIFAARRGKISILQLDDSTQESPVEASEIAAVGGTVVLSAQYPQSFIPNIAMSASGDQVAIGLEGGAIALLQGLTNAAMGGRVQERRFQLHLQPDLHSLTFLGEERLLAVGGIAVVLYTGSSPPSVFTPISPTVDPEVDEDIFAAFARSERGQRWRQLTKDDELNKIATGTESERYLANIAKTGDVVVTERATGNRVSRIDTEGLRVFAMSILPGERELALGLSDRTLRIVDLRTGTTLLETETGYAPAQTFAFDPMTKSLLAFTFESQIFEDVIEVSLDFRRCEGLLAYGESLLRRQLTEDERAIFGLSEQNDTSYFSSFYARFRKAALSHFRSRPVECE